MWRNYNASIFICGLCRIVWLQVLKIQNAQVEVPFVLTGVRNSHQASASSHRDPSFFRCPVLQAAELRINFMVHTIGGQEADSLAQTIEVALRRKTQSDLIMITFLNCDPNAHFLVLGWRHCQQVLIVVIQRNRFSRNLMLSGALDRGIMQQLTEIGTDSSDSDDEKYYKQLNVGGNDLNALLVYDCRSDVLDVYIVLDEKLFISEAVSHYYFEYKI